MSDTSILWEETVRPGATWSHVLKRGTALRLTDVQGAFWTLWVELRFYLLIGVLRIEDPLLSATWPITGQSTANARSRPRVIPTTMRTPISR